MRRRKYQSAQSAARWIAATLFVIGLLMLFGVSDEPSVTYQVLPPAGSKVPMPAAADGTTAAIAGAVVTTP